MMTLCREPCGDPGVCATMLMLAREMTDADYLQERHQDWTQQMPSINAANIDEDLRTLQADDVSHGLEKKSTARYVAITHVRYRQ